MALSYNLGYQESISVHPTRRQIFAGKPYSTFLNIWKWIICNFWPSKIYHFPSRYMKFLSFPNLIPVKKHYSSDPGDYISVMWLCPSVLVSTKVGWLCGGQQGLVVASSPPPFACTLHFALHCQHTKRQNVERFYLLPYPSSLSLP